MSATVGTSEILWSNLVAAALVAALTALAVEYMAKPRLEMRKERILEMSRDRRNRLRALNRFLFMAGRILALQDKQDQRIFRDRTIRFAMEAESVLDSIIESTGGGFDDLEEAWDAVYGPLAGMVIGLQTELPPDGAWKDFDIASDRLDEVVAYLETPKWRWWRRRALRAAIRGWVLSTSTGR